MSNTSKERKDKIVVDDSLIGREIFCRNKDISSYLIPNKRYTIIDTDNDGIDGVTILTNGGMEAYTLINVPSNHLNGHNWLLAARTSSSQSVVRTVSGRKL